ncbi:MAG: hypothetical protein Q4A76_08155 [Porphyromonadaceae bacterium]|nr:hypothetical protein [Porphyromonadaceae bacterium]
MDIGNSRVLTRKTSSINMQTGEVIEKEESVLLRTKKRERFMLLYVENFAAIVNLSKRSQEVLARILTKKVTFGTNEAVLDSVFRAELAEQIGSSRQVIANCIAELVQKKILKREKRTGGYLFFLNPYLFGQGEWNTIEKQRQQFTIDYDFINYTAAKEIKTITAYEGIPDKENIQIIKREKYTDENGVEQHDVFIDTKDEAFESNAEEIEIGMNNALIIDDERKEKELSIKELEAKNREKELSIKELELKVKMEELSMERNRT